MGKVKRIRCPNWLPETEGRTNQSCLLGIARFLSEKKNIQGSYRSWKIMEFSIRSLKVLEMADISFNIACKQLKIAQIAQLN